jgi:hypothetical protein
MRTPASSRRIEHDPGGDHLMITLRIREPSTELLLEICPDGLYPPDITSVDLEDDGMLVLDALPVFLLADMGARHKHLTTDVVSAGKLPIQNRDFLSPWLGQKLGPSASI